MKTCSIAYVLLVTAAIPVLFTISELLYETSLTGDTGTVIAIIAHGLSIVLFFHLITKCLGLPIAWRIAVGAFFPILVYTIYYATIHDHIRGPVVFAIHEMFVFTLSNFLHVAQSQSLQCENVDVPRMKMDIQMAIQMLLRVVAVLCLFICVGAVSAQEKTEFVRGLERPSLFPSLSGEKPDTILKGVPKRYHFLYTWDFDKKDDEIRDALPFTSIELSRTACLGRCPAYRARLELNGAASYYGQQFAPRDGHFVGTVNPYSFARLCWALERLDLVNDKRVPTTSVYDTPETILRIVRKDGDELVELSDYGSGTTIELLLFATLTDKVVDGIEWKPKPKKNGEPADARKDRASSIHNGKPTPGPR